MVFIRRRDSVVYPKYCLVKCQRLKMTFIQYHMQLCFELPFIKTSNRILGTSRESCLIKAKAIWSKAPILNGPFSPNITY